MKNCKQCVDNKCMGCFDTPDPAPPPTEEEDDGWIECGLPFSLPILPEEPNLFEKYTKQTGIDIEKILNPDYINTALESWATKAKEVNDNHLLYWSWFDKQPETWVWESECKKIRESKNTFCEQELNKPGTLIEAEWNGETERILIGHVNAHGDSGIYKDPFLPGNAIIKKYKVIWSED